MAYVAYYFGWPHAQLMDMNHLERLGWVAQVARINKELDASPGGDASG